MKDINFDFLRFDSPKIMIALGLVFIFIYIWNKGVIFFVIGLITLVVGFYWNFKKEKMKNKVYAASGGGDGISYPKTIKEIVNNN